MQVELNSRGNGACPLCSLRGKCRVQDTLQNAITPFFEEGDPMELVVYSCPKFQEKIESE
jgi:hypothetical protein